MQIFLENIGLIILQVLSFIGELTISLLSNPIFAILMGTIIFIILFNLLINLTKNIKEKRQWKREYSQDARRIEDDEYNDFLDSIM